MSAAPAITAEPPRRGRAVVLCALPAVLIAMVLGGIMTGACYSVAGPSLGLFFGGVVAAALIGPALAAGEATRAGTLLSAAGVLHGVAAVWFVAVVRAGVNPGQWLACYVTLAAFVFAIGGLVAMLRRAGWPPAAAAAAVTLLACLWLTWPVWLGAALASPAGDRLVDWLAPAHPLAAVNHAVIDLGIWPQSFDVAYNLSNLGNDVPYALPTTVLWSVLLHGAIAAAAFALARRRRSN